MISEVGKAVCYVVSLLKLVFVLSLAFLLPQFCIRYNCKPKSNLEIIGQSSEFKLGVDNFSPSLLKEVSHITDRQISIGLVTNQIASNLQGNKNIDTLKEKGFFIKKIFIPYAGDLAKINQQYLKSNSSIVQEMVPIKNVAHHFTNQSLQDIDVLVLDMQDGGMRCHGGTSFLHELLKVAHHYKKKIIVLDRPNLLGWCMEGALGSAVVDEAGQEPFIPARYGMTIGEIATYFNKYFFQNNVQLSVVSMQDYNRNSQQKLSQSLSTNITSIDSCYGYSFLGLLGEVVPFDIAIGTDKAFQCILLPDSMKFPKQKWIELSSKFKSQGIDSKFYRCFSSRKKQYCSGLRLSVNDINRFSSFSTLIFVLQFFKQAGVTLTFSDQFDRVSGTSKLRQVIEGTVSKKDLAQEVNVALQTFFKKATSCFLYKPFPKIINV